jgi:hypothetical protein
VRAVSLSSVVLLASWEFDSWDLPRFAPLENRTWMSGGHRTLLELAAAAAAAGCAVELRGVFIEREVESIEAAARVQLGRPRQARPRTSADIVIVPEGLADPLLFAREALSPARAVVAVLGAPGLFGWSFGSGGPPRDLLTVDTEAVGRPEQLESAHRLGLEIWTNLAGIAEQARAIGLPHHYVGVGRPEEYPDPPTKRVDVATLADNKWAPLARAAVAGLRPGVSHVELPCMPRDRLLLELGAARTLVHPVRIEGRSRLCEEAKAMGTVPIMLASNRFGEGLDPASGAIAADTIEAIAPAVHELLDDPQRLDGIAQAGRRQARDAARWQPFVERVAAALADPDRELARSRPGRAALGASLSAREERLCAEHDSLRADRDRLLAEQDRLRTEYDALTGQLTALGAEERKLTAALTTAERRYVALRQRRVVRAALRLGAALERVRRARRRG